MAVRAEPASGRSVRGAAAVGFLALAAVGLWLYQPYASYREMHSEISVLEAGISELEVANARLARSASELETQRGIELELRRQGWVRANERVVRTFPYWGVSAPLQETPAARTDVAAQVTDAIARSVECALGRAPAAQ